MAGLWDYDDDAVQAYEPEDPSSSYSSVSDDEVKPALKRGRKKKAGPPARKHTLPEKESTEELAEPLCIDIDDSDDEDDIVLVPIKKNKTVANTLEEAPTFTPSTDPIPANNNALNRLKQGNEFLQKLQEATKDDVEIEEAPELPPRCQSFGQPIFSLPQASSSTFNVVSSREPEPILPPPPTYAADTAVNEGPQIIVNVQSKHGRAKIKIYTRKPLSKLVDKFKEYAVQQKWITPDQLVKLQFDGEILNPNETAEDLDMEAEDAVDAEY